MCRVDRKPNRGLSRTSRDFRVSRGPVLPSHRRIRSPRAGSDLGTDVPTGPRRTPPPPAGAAAAGRVVWVCASARPPRTRDRAWTPRAPCVALARPLPADGVSGPRPPCAGRRGEERAAAKSKGRRPDGSAFYVDVGKGTLRTKV